MKLSCESYAAQVARWPQEGRHIMAQFDADSVVVYQAYNPRIGGYAAQHGHFGGDFSFARMSWIKPNFLWMMYRSGWGTKPDQEVTLAVRLRRPFFERILGQAVVSSFDASHYPSHEEWQKAVVQSEVRLQFDPDHDPRGKPLARRALQLGLRGATLREYGGDALLDIEDISDFVAQQRKHAQAGDYQALLTPSEAPYLPGDTAAVARLGLAVIS